MKIGFVFPNRDRKDKTVHLGIGYLVSYAREKHTDVEFSLLDTRVATKKERHVFFESDFDLIGITVLSPVYHEVARVFQEIRAKIPQVPICLGGPYVTTIMEEIFISTPADFAVYGEGEITFSELIGYLKGNNSISDIQGLMYRDAEGAIQTNTPRPHEKNLDKFSIPAYDLFPMNRYPMHRITTSRGCPFQCVFCNSSTIWSAKWRKRSPEKIVDEIEHLIKYYNKKIFFFNDNSFNLDKKRVEKFCNLLIEKNIRIIWSTPVRVELITKPLARLMKKAGCYNVGIGIESANNLILKRMNKQNTIEAIERGIRIFKGEGIEVLGQFVIGSPGDTLETVKESIQFAKHAQLDFVMFYSILPFKGTEQWEYIQKEGRLLQEKIHDFHDIKPRIVFDTPEFPYRDRLEAIQLAKNEGFYSETNDKSKLFDFGKDVAQKVQQYLPQKMANSIYFILKNFYRRVLLKHRLS